MSVQDRHQEKLGSGTKQERLIDLLTRKDGASIAELVAEMGWKANSVHSALSTLRCQGSKIAIQQDSGVKRYRMLYKP